MFCLYCREYQGLDEPCNYGIRMTDFQRMLKCKHYQYNGDVDGQEV